LTRTRFDAVDVEQVAAVVGDQRVDEQHVGAELDEPRARLLPMKPRPPVIITRRPRRG
jgi:hypothetical protein